MLFGRQQNLVRRAVRPHGREVRQLRRRSIGRATLLELRTGAPPPSAFRRLLRGLARLVGRS